MEAATSIEKALDVLFHLHAASAPQGVSAIGRALGFPKSSAHRLLAALARRDLVERDERGRYRAGIGLVALGLGALDGEPAVAAARPVLEREAETLGETVFLVGARARRLVVLAKAEGNGFLRAAPRVGASVPVHATAVGKLYLAIDPAQVAQPESPERFTSRTRTGPRALAREVASATARGFATNREEWMPGLSVVAAPVSACGRLHAAVAVAAPTPRLEALGEARVARRAVAAGQEIGARLEGRSGGAEDGRR